jgi:Ca2+-binding RTX toxin-like protein
MTDRLFEPLETRRLMSAQIIHYRLRGAETFVLFTDTGGAAVSASGWGGSAQLTSRGTLVVHGSGAGDEIAVALAKGLVIVRGQTIGTTADAAVFRGAFSASAVKRVLVECNGGNDRAGVAADIGRRCTLVGGGGHDRLSGSQGDVLIGGAGDDKLAISRDRPIGMGDIVVFRDDDQGNAILSGGDGNDTLVASISDTVVGGRGDDTAVVHRYLSSTALSEAIEPVSFARDAFGERAVGIEHFDTFTDRIPQQVFTLP